MPSRRYARANLPSPGPDLIIEPAGQDDISSPGIELCAM